MNTNQDLPAFRPFTLEQVKAMTGVTTATLDAWTKEDAKVLRLLSGEGAIGLNWMQTFAVFVGHKYLMEGAGMDRAKRVVKFLATLVPDTLMQNINAGLCWPVPAEMDPVNIKHVSGVFVEAPKSPLGNRLRLDRLGKEFQANVDALFPAKPQLIVPTH